MFFVGTHELTIDGKNRLSIPYGIRCKLNPDEDGRGLYVLPGERVGTLALYSERYFEKLRGEAPPADAISSAAVEWRQFEYSQCALLDPDSQGRVLIPDRLLRRVDMHEARDVVLIGVQDHMEVWRRAEYERFVEQRWPDYPSQRRAALKELNELGVSRRAVAAPGSTQVSPM